MPVNDYSTTPGSNTSINGINIAEGCPPGNVNDAIRQLLADIAGWRSGSVAPLFTAGGTLAGAYIASGAWSFGSTVSIAGVATFNGNVIFVNPVTFSSTISLSAPLGVASGGTGAATFTAGRLLKGNGTAAVAAGSVQDEGVSEAMRITSGNNLAIGLTSAVRRLEVRGGGFAAANKDQYAVGISNSAGTVDDLTFGTDANYGYVQTWNAKPLYLNSQGNNILTGPGNVGINTASPTERLDVTGNIKASGTVSAGGIELGYRDLPRVGSLTRGACFATAAGVTINTATAGNLFTIYNDSGSAITITQGGGVTLRLAGTTGTGNRTLGARGVASVWFNSASEAIISGPGVS